MQSILSKLIRVSYSQSQLHEHGIHFQNHWLMINSKMTIPFQRKQYTAK